MTEQLSTIDLMRKELYEFFELKITPKIETEEHNPELLKEIELMFSNKFSNKFSYIVRHYSNTIRVSAWSYASGITFFMAATKKGHENHKFKEKSYIK